MSGGRHSVMARGLPGRLTISVRPRTPAIARDKIAVGTVAKLRIRIASPKPGSSFSSTSRVASGVTSRRAGPVPPVVITRVQASRSHSSRNAAAIAGRSSGSRRTTKSHSPFQTCRNTRSISGPLRSW